MTRNDYINAIADIEAAIENATGDELAALEAELAELAADFADHMDRR